MRMCIDLDPECEDIRNKVTCYAFEPWRGICPYLQKPKIFEKEHLEKIDDITSNI